MGGFKDLIITDQEYADKGMTSLSGTKWNNQAEMLKAKLDEDGTFVGKRLEQVLLLLDSEDAAKNIGVNVPWVVDKNVQAILVSHDASIRNMYTSPQVDTIVSTNTNDLVASVTFNPQDGKFTITKKDGAVQTIDTLLEKVPVSMVFETVGDVTRIKLTNSDNSTSVADVSSLVDNYTFNNTTTIAVHQSGSGNQRAVGMSVRPGTIGVEHLDVVAITQLENYKDQAVSSAESAAAAASSATASAANASTSSSTATTAAASASSSATTASSAASNSQASSIQSESWAVGGTDARDGENTNNAKYWSEQAASAVASVDALLWQIRLDVLKQGSFDAGYYGKVNGLITGADLCTAAGLTAGTLAHSGDITFLKFSHKHKTLLVADRVIRRTISWDNIQAQNLVKGKVVEIKGLHYLCRLMTGGNSNPASSAGGEWDDLIVQFTPNDGDSHWDGMRTWCQEIHAGHGIDYRVHRGQSSVDTFTTWTSPTASAIYGYRPVLELL